MKNRITAIVLAAVMVLIVIFSAMYPAFAESNTITISNADDFLAFSKKCTLDTWSQGKTVILGSDIDLGNKDFKPIATFGGTFDGKGFSISGIDFSGNGSYIGLFRHIQPGGKIINLNVKGSFIPDGSKSYVGGIAGENSGIIENCSFDGTVKGNNVIGGITGFNNDSGKLTSCSSSGTVAGENSTGGIVGKNSGFILSCVNNASVNTVYEEKKNTLEDMENMETDVGAIVENNKNSQEQTEEESVFGNTDTGGIAGFSSGIIQGCTNNSNVGYQHIGYNVGGIAGRQSGYMLGCENKGLIQGRKDVGGICGQAEPYILLQTSSQTLKDIKNELDNLHSIVNRFIANTDNLSDDIESNMTNISDNAKKAQDNAEILIDKGTDFVDDNLSEINAQTAIISNTLDKLEPIFEDLENGGEDLAAALDEIGEALDDIKIYTPHLSDDLDDMRDAVSVISNAERSMKKASARFNRALNDLDDGIEFKNQTKVHNALSEMSASVKDIIKAKQDIKTAVETIEQTLKTKPEDFEDIGINANKILDNLKIIKDNVVVKITALSTIKESIDTLIMNTEINFSEFQSAARNIEAAIDYLEDGMYYIRTGLEDLMDGAVDVTEELEDWADDTIDELREAKRNLSDALDSLSFAADDIELAMNDIKDIISDLADEEPMEFVKLGEDFENASDGLFDSLDDISDSLDVLKNSISKGTDNLSADISSISNQFNLIMNLMIDKIEDLEDGTKSPEDVFVDVSDEEIEGTRQGKIAQCTNYGTVKADRNIGGITGAMAIEYSKDPEDDIEKPDALNFTYRTKAILQSCVNNGEINGKKDCTGGIVGLSEIGTVYRCENYGNIESTNGDYIGGIAGKSESSIRRSYSKAKVTGKRYVGGVAGKADSMTSCYAIVTIEGDENLGAICGDAESLNNMYQNFFVDHELGGVDDISYSGKAQPITFEELKNMSGIPRKFISFTVTFIVDDEILEVQEIEYADSVKRIKYPQIPPKEGEFGVWEEPECEVVKENIELECEYKPYITILSSEEKDDTGKLSLALADGEFTNKSELHAVKSAMTPPKEARGNVAAYDISFVETSIAENDTVTIRLLNKNKDDVTAWKSVNGTWEKVDVSYRGKYVMLETTGTNSTICLQFTERTFNYLWIIIPVLAVFAIAFVFAGKKHKKMK